ncbi:hypothetical protein B0H14DRAFT_2338193 [Mycena olivaceomarginata]|nr:hypothetical protein B0H14DRAFT_2338193 [Mycena olivaceomarginata]
MAKHAVSIWFFVFLDVALSPVNIQHIYRAWCKKNNFESKLEDDISARKKAAADAEEVKSKLHQQTLIPHLRDKPERVVPYSDSAFRNAALEWLIATDQPIDALNHPKFKEMINFAACATNGVKIPSGKAARDEILNLFQKQMENLRVRIHVSFPSSHFPLCL